MKDGKREILIGAVGLVKGSVRNGGKVMLAVCDELEPKIEKTGFLTSAPFEVISIILRYGTKWGEPEIGKINKRHSELEVAIEIPMEELRFLAEPDLFKIIKRAVLLSLMSVAKKYNLEEPSWD